MLLAKRSKDKIRIRNRQKIPLRLRPLIRPFPPHSTCPNRNERLPNLIPRTPGIRIRINKGIDPSLLIRLEMLATLDCNAPHESKAQQKQRCLTKPNPTQKQPGDQYR